METNVNWEIIGTVAEMIGAGGVIASLIYHWEKARVEFNEEFATYVDEQLAMVEG